MKNRRFPETGLQRPGLKTAVYHMSALGIFFAAASLSLMSNDRGRIYLSFLKVFADYHLAGSDALGEAAGYCHVCALHPPEIKYMALVLDKQKLTLLNEY